MDWLLIAQAAPTPPAVPTDLEWVETIAAIASRLGIPGGVAGGLYLLVRVGRWMQPWAEKFFVAHLDLIDSLKEWQKASSEKLNRIDTKTDATHAAITCAVKAAEKIGRTTPHAEIINDHAREIREALE